MVRKANEGFCEGRVTKQSLASWLLLSIQEKQFEKVVPTIQKDHVDPVRLMQIKLAELIAERKTAKATGKFRGGG